MKRTFACVCPTAIRVRVQKSRKKWRNRVCIQSIGKKQPPMAWIYECTSWRYTYTHRSIVLHTVRASTYWEYWCICMINFSHWKLTNRKCCFLFVVDIVDFSIFCFVLGLFHSTFRLSDIFCLRFSGLRRNLDFVIPLKWHSTRAQLFCPFICTFSYFPWICWTWNGKWFALWSIKL